MPRPPKLAPLSPANDGSTISEWDRLTKFMDPSGKLNFGGKAVVHAQGVDFTSGHSYKIAMSELQLLEELGRGQYGVVNKVFHRPTGVTMAMKQIRLDISDALFNQILMELDVLHRSQCPYIIEFYGAFFIESCVYYCMEFMDAGSLDKLYGQGVPEDILARIAESTVRGLKLLKDDLNIMHRDIKPTNILLNKRGEIKLCDFGVSGKLIQSLAKTNIGCQSYMAPERIAYSENPTYKASADVWSLGITLWEVAMGRYPYSGKRYDSVFAQLNAIVSGQMPPLHERFSPDCQDFISICLAKSADDRPSYSQLLDHPFLVKHRNQEIDMKAWAEQACAQQKPTPAQ